MKSPSRAAAVLALLLACTVVNADAAVTLPLGVSPEIPAAEGKARLSRTKNGNIEIRLRVKHLAPPARIAPGSNVFVVWSRGQSPGADAQNLGALVVDKNLNGRLRATTALSSFDLFITCELSQTITAPTPPELLPLHFVGK